MKNWNTTVYNIVKNTNFVHLGKTRINGFMPKRKTVVYNMLQKICHKHFQTPWFPPQHNWTFTTDERKPGARVLDLFMHFSSLFHGLLSQKPFYSIINNSNEWKDNRTNQIA